jgi:hypothetical protein
LTSQISKRSCRIKLFGTLRMIQNVQSNDDMFSTHSYIQPRSCILAYSAKESFSLSVWQKSMVRLGIEPRSYTSSPSASQNCYFDAFASQREPRLAPGGRSVCAKPLHHLTSGFVVRDILVFADLRYGREETKKVMGDHRR